MNLLARVLGLILFFQSEVIVCESIVFDLILFIDSESCIESSVPAGQGRGSLERKGVSELSMLSLL